MGDCFQGWRRKAGCQLLIMATLLVTSWLRSLTSDEQAVLRLDGTCHLFRHADGRIKWQRFAVPHDLQLPFSASLLEQQEGPRSNFAFHYSGWHSSELLDEDLDLAQWRFDSDCWMIGHWLLAVPITLLAAHLILWRRIRPAKHARTSEAT